MSRRPASTARHFVRAVTFLSVFFLMGNAAFAQDKTGAGDKIKELKEQRLVLLVKIHRFALEGWKQGIPTFTLAQVYQAQTDLFAARLDLAEKKEDRIKICEAAVKDAEAWLRWPWLCWRWLSQPPVTNFSKRRCYGTVLI